MPQSPQVGKSRFRVSRAALERIQRIHRSIQAGEYPNCSTLAVMLEVSPKTIQRDLDWMRDRDNLPVEFHRVKNGYFYRERVAGMPTVHVTEGEVVALYIAQKVLAQYKGTPFDKPLSVAFEKLTAGLPETISFPLHGLDDTITFRTSGMMEADLVIFKTLYRAVNRKEEVRFKYKSLRDRFYKTRYVQPYHLLGAANSWYLIAFDKNRADFRMFSLSRMQNLKLEGGNFTRMTNFNPQHLLQGSLGVFIGKGEYRIRVRFDAFASQLIRERKWHESQEVVELAEDELELRLTLSSLFEVERWILSWGAHARVLEPAELVTQVQAKIEAMLEVYRDREETDETVIEFWEQDSQRYFPALTAL